MFAKIYKTLIIDFSRISITIICAALTYFLYFSKDFKLDASSDSLLLESDKDLKYLREVNERYGSKDYLVLTYSPILSFTDSETRIFNSLGISYGYHVQHMCPLSRENIFSLYSTIPISHIKLFEHATLPVLHF